MQDSKDNGWNGNFPASRDGDHGNGHDAAGIADPDGWQQYRKWISKAPAPKGRRRNIDPSLYTWKGYRLWTEQIKRNWSDNS
ncbi:MAG: hypothetical protein ACREQZ_13025 [Woeseiaceae bacterium]